MEFNFENLQLRCCLQNEQQGAMCHHYQVWPPGFLFLKSIGSELKKHGHFHHFNSMFREIMEALKRFFLIRPELVAWHLHASLFRACADF